MGFFKELKDLKKNADELTKGQKRPSLMDGMKQANQAMEDLQGQQQSAQHLMTNGVDATATVQSLMSTGKTVNMMPEIQFVLDVSVGGGAPYSVTHSQVVSPVSIPMVQMGMTVPVKVDPADQQQVYLLVQ
jgi:hypothetical protein